MLIDITEHSRPLWPCPSRVGSSDAGVAMATGMLLGWGSRGNCARNTKKLPFNSPARPGASQCPRRALPSLILLLVGRFSSSGLSRDLPEPLPAVPGEELLSQLALREFWAAAMSAKSIADYQHPSFLIHGRTPAGAGNVGNSLHPQLPALLDLGSGAGVSLSFQAALLKSGTRT